jgi:hypothetical protein
LYFCLRCFRGKRRNRKSIHISKPYSCRGRTRPNWCCFSCCFST